MPEISRFYGIVIKMFFDDHGPPHLHAYYGDSEAFLFSAEVCEGLTSGSFCEELSYVLYWRIHMVWVLIRTHIINS